MDKKQLIAWITTAYPSVKLYQDKYFSSNRKDIQAILYDSEIEFPEFQVKVSEPDDIETYCGMIWGGSKISMAEYNKPKKRSVRNFVKQEEVKQPIPEKKEVEVTVQKPLPDSFNREVLLNILCTLQPGKDKIKLSSGSIMYGTGGPVLGRFGFSPSQEKTHIFIPYSHTEKVKQFIKNYR